MRLRILDAAVPPDWSAATIADVCSRVTSGGTPSRKHHEYFGGDIGWVKTKELHDSWIDSTEETLTSEGLENSSAKLLPARTLLMAMYGATVGQLGILQRELSCNQAACAMIVDPKRADYRYVYYQLLNARPQIIDMATGAAQQNLNARTIKEFEIPLAPLQEQRGIAATLGALDDKIDSNHRLVQTVSALIQTEFQKVVRTGRIERLPLGEVAVVTKGRSYKSSELQPSATALVTLKSVDRAGGYKTDGLKPYTGPYKVEQIVRPGEVIVAQTDLTQGAEVVGRGVRVPKVPEFENLVASLDLAIVRPRKEMPQEYLYGLLASEDFRQHCRNHVTGTTVLHLSKDAIPTWHAPVIPMLEQHRYASKVRPLFANMDSAVMENQRLSAVRDALLPELLSGRIRVLEAQEAVLEATGN